MSKQPTTNPQIRAKSELMLDLFELAQILCAQKTESVLHFARQTVHLQDSDAVETFLSWKDDPVIDSILLLAAKMDAAARAELLDAAEMISDEHSGLKKGRGRQRLAEAG